VTDIERTWGPVVEGRRRRRAWRLVLGACATLVVVVGLAAWWASAQIPRTDVSGLAATSRPLHVLVVGSDSRAGLTPEERRELATGDVDGERADTIFVLTLDGGRAAMLAFPRDLWVRRCDGTEGRINTAVALGGPSCMVETVRSVSGIHASHYVEVTFGGFRGLVDAVGGVELCLDAPISDRDAGIDLPAGCQRLDGADALGFVRVRKIDDDLHRIERQQTFVQALAREIASPASLVPSTAYRLARDAGGAVTVDDSMGVASLARVAIAGRSLAAGRVVSHTVPVTPATGPQGAAVLNLQVARAETLFARFRTGAVLDEATASGSADAPRPQDVEVRVVNAAGIAGLAASTADRLEERGFVVVSLDNAALRDHSGVAHPPGSERAAALVADTLGLSGRLVEDGTLSHVTVVLGTDQEGAP
jgi:LCP family protein required for cell wall assembly